MFVCVCMCALVRGCVCARVGSPAPAAASAPDKGDSYPKDAGGSGVPAAFCRAGHDSDFISLVHPGFLCSSASLFAEFRANGGVRSNVPGTPEPATIAEDVLAFLNGQAGFVGWVSGHSLDDSGELQVNDHPFFKRRRHLIKDLEDFAGGHAAEALRVNLQQVRQLLKCVKNAEWGPDVAAAMESWAEGGTSSAEAGGGAGDSSGSALQARGRSEVATLVRRKSPVLALLACPVFDKVCEFDRENEYFYARQWCVGNGGRGEGAARTHTHAHARSGRTP